MKQILNDVYWIDTGMVNCYLVRDGAELCLIDTGMPRAADQLLEAVAEIGAEPGDVTRILLTHADIDHAGGLSACLGATGATPFSSAESAALVAKGQSPRHLPSLIQFIGDIFFRYPAVPAESITVLKDGDVLPLLGGLEVLATPGHTLDHLSFYSHSANIVFAGDIVSTRDDRLQLTPPRITVDGVAARQSAQRLIDLAPAVLACGHGAPLTENITAQLTSLAQEIRPTGG